MSEVSCRAFTFFLNAERAGVCRVEDLIEGLPLTRSQLERTGDHVPWDAWARLTDRFGEVCGSEQALIDTCRFAMDDRFAGSLSRVAGMFAAPRLLYRVSLLWVAQGLYRSVRFAVTELDGGRLRLEATLLPGYRESRTWFTLFAHGVLLAPTFVGLPPAEPDSLTCDARSARVVIRMSGRRRPSIWRRLWMPFSSGGTIARELVSQQADLTRAFDDMRRATVSFQNILDALPLAVAVIRDGRIRYGNPSLARLVGVDADRLRNRTLREYVRAEDAPVVAALEAGASTVGRFRLIGTGTDDVVLDARAVGGASFEGEEAVIVIGLDVSADVRARAHRERSEATIRLLIETQPELVMRLDASLRLLDVQPGQGIEEAAALAATVGQDARTLVSMLPPDLVAQFAQLIRDYETHMAEGRVFERALLLQTEGGQSRELHLRGTPVLDGAESILVVRDDTRRREVERRLALAEHMSSLGVLSAGVTHEINNPLTYVALSIDALDDEVREIPSDHGERLRDLVSALREGTERIRSTVSRMKGLTRPGTGTRTRVTPRPIVESALAIVAHETSRRARVVVELHETGDVLADATELGQVFINLLVNAAQALDRAPSLEARVHIIRVRFFEEDGMVVFECEDTGEGIAPDLRTRIFDPFFTTKERRQGTGLGLSIVHRIVRDLAGVIEVRSSQGRGSLFRVTLPVAPPDAAVAPPIAAMAPVTEPSLRARVFVIDDEPMIARLVVRALGAHDVSPFTQARDALAALRGGDTPDLLLCDIEMPGLSGMELYEQVVSDRPELGERFVFLTGGAFTERALAFVSRPGIRVVQKPTDRATLLRLVGEAVERRRS
jgi:signal transduction histidine kinase